MNLSDEILIKAPENNGLLTRGIITQENSPIYDFELSFKEQVWSNPISVLYEEGKIYNGMQQQIFLGMKFQV